MTQDVRVRFAPSPTGHLHIGGARTAIYNWAFARHHGGTFILRIDDTDPERSTTENTLAILRALRWLGLDWDEGPEAGGTRGPYFQTQRSASYAEALVTLRASGHAYPCFCSAEELESKREVARVKGGYAGYDRACRSISVADAAVRVEAKEPHVWRIAVPQDRGDVVFHDAVRGELSFPPAALDDFVLVRTDGTPTYNYATVVDDALMEITHVIRGDDHLSNTPRQILVFEALGHDVPTFAHLSMILGADGKRLSKRLGAVSVEAYRDDGFLPEALLNYLTLLGFALDGDTTVFSASQLIEGFDLERVSKNAAIFDAEKLEWLNGVYMRELTPEALVDRMTPLLIEAGLLTSDEALARHDWLVALAPLVAQRLKRMDEVVPMVSFLFADDVEIDPAARDKVLSDSHVSVMLHATRSAMSDVEPYDTTSLEAALKALPEALDVKPKALFQAVRVAVTGSTVSLPLFESLELLGRDLSVRRIDAAIALVDAS
ncbi:MAG: glutamate--tRNA ligase [Coriobacteriia bacterium]|nr:glutamate--tRNA ligase [Coriobacteriia bacterium]